MTMKYILTLLALTLSSSAFAANEVALQSAVFVEKMVADTDGRSRAILQEPRVVVPGDKLVFVLSYHNLGHAPASNFVVTNPMPGAVAFQAASDQTAQVSVDGGRNWGAISQLRIKEQDGTVRNARPEDVTHVRWALKGAIPVGAQGKLSFRGIVR
jgi:uncharacterized repeat protein (TIGR01451 family)